MQKVKESKETEDEGKEGMGYEEKRCLKSRNQEERRGGEDAGSQESRDGK